jgi:hypothetical protein
MKTTNLSDRAWKLIKSTLYALQVLAIAAAIPVLGYVELSRSEKPEEPAVKDSISAEKPEPLAYTFIKI